MENAADVGEPKEALDVPAFPQWVGSQPHFAVFRGRLAVVLYGVIAPFAHRVLSLLYWVGLNVHQEFSVAVYGKPRTNILANPILRLLLYPPKGDISRDVFLKL